MIVGINTTMTGPGTTTKITTTVTPRVGDLLHRSHHLLGLIMLHCLEVLPESNLLLTGGIGEGVDTAGGTETSTQAPLGGTKTLGDRIGQTALLVWTALTESRNHF